MSESTNNDDKPNNPNSNENQPTYYERRKNLISGVDNSHLAIGIASFGALAGFTALLFPEQIQRLKENISNLFQKKQPELPPPPVVQPEYQEEPYIPPTPPQNMHQQQVIQPQQPNQQQQIIEEAVQQEEQTQQQQQEEEQEPEMFYDDELQKRERRLLGKNRRMDKYDSPFGAGIANS